MNDWKLTRALGHVLTDVYGWIIPLLEAIIITNFMYLANVANTGFPESIVFDQDRRGYWKRIIVLLKPQYERGAHRCGWKYGLIEVDLMPTLAEEYSTLGDVDSRLTDYVVGKSIVLGLDLSLRAKDVIKKEPCIPMFHGKIKRKLERQGTLVILLVIQPITPPWIIGKL